MTEVSSAIDAYNKQRSELAAERKAAYGKQNLIMAGLAIAVAALAFYVYRNGGIGGTIAVVFIGLFTLGIAFAVMRGSADSPGVALQAELREQVFPALFPEVGGLTFTANTKGFYDEIPDGVKPGSGTYRWGDLIEGTYKGQPIALNEVSITKTTKKGDQNETEQVFKGVTIRAGLAQRVPDLIVSKNRLAVARWVSSKFGARADTPHVAFADQTFEDHYDVHCASESYARAVFTDDGRQTYAVLEGTHAQGTLQLAATSDTVYLLVEHDHNYFELPPLDRPFNEGTDGRELKAEMDGFLALIDGVRALLEPAAAAQFKL